MTWSFFLFVVTWETAKRKRNQNVNFEAVDLLLHSIIEHDNTLEPCPSTQTVFNQQSDLPLCPSAQNFHFPADESSCAIAFGVRMKPYPALTRKRFFLYIPLSRCDRDTAEGFHFFVLSCWVSGCLLGCAILVFAFRL
jgi:hypothetical protein